jgi:hypothetical protein
MTRFEKAERKGPSRGPGRVQAICVSDLKTGAISVNGMISLFVDDDVSIQTVDVQY